MDIESTSTETTETAPRHYGRRITDEEYFALPHGAPYVRSNRKTVYVERRGMGCVSRLCILSAEYFRTPDDKWDGLVVPGETFDRFAEKTLRCWNVEIGEEHRPYWAQPGWTPPPPTDVDVVKMVLADPDEVEAD